MEEYQDISGTLITPPSLPQPKSSCFINVCCPCISCFSVISLVTASITYLVFAIIGLVNTSHKEIQDICPNSNIWIYLLVILILNGGFFGNNIKAIGERKKSGACGIICNLLLQMGFLCWGAYEIWGVSCVDEIRPDLVYTMAEINVIATIVIIGITIVAVCLICAHN